MHMADDLVIRFAQAAENMMGTDPDGDNARRPADTNVKGRIPEERRYRDLDCIHADGTRVNAGVRYRGTETGNKTHRVM